MEDIFSKLSFDEGQFELILDYLRKNKIGIDEEINLDDYLSEEDKNYLEYYLMEMKELPELTDGEEKAILLAAMAGEISAKEKTITFFLPKVVEIAKLYTMQGILIEDLIGEGNVSLAIGVEMIGCLEHPEEVEGFLGNMIMEAMEKYITNQDQCIQQDQGVLDRLNDMLEASKALVEKMQRKVTIEEMLAETDFTRDEIETMIQMAGGSIDTIEDIEHADGK